MQNRLEQFEDKVCTGGEAERQNRYSEYCDFIYYPSSVTPGITLAMRVCKPAKPSYILATTHGWHMNIEAFREDMGPSEYLCVEVDMRGRAWSQGKQDCNGLELFDVIDAVEYVKTAYASYILDPDVVYFDAGSGGGGNAFALAGKFPDYFAHITAMSGISDYALWYENDEIGEFRDEMDVWIGDIANRDAYRSRSGLWLAENRLSPMHIIHGETDVRVPSVHSRLYAAAARQNGCGDLVQYWEIPGVGTRSHWGNATEEQLAQIGAFAEAGRAAHRTPVSMPRRGEMAVGGYLVTKAFSVMLDDIDDCARVRYDLDSGEITVIGAKGGYTVRRFAEENA